MMELDVIGCVPIDCPPINGKKFQPYKGSVQRTCPGCNRAVWVGPESMKLVTAGTARISCLLCILKEHGPNIQFQQLTDKKMGE